MSRTKLRPDRPSVVHPGHTVKDIAIYRKHKSVCGLALLIEKASLVSKVSSQKKKAAMHPLHIHTDFKVQK